MLFTADMPDALVAKALRLAHEGALSSWARAVQIHPCPTEAMKDLDVGANEFRFYYPLRGGKWIITETTSGNRHALNVRALAEGARILAICYPSALVPLLGHERPVTALDGDALVQCAIFGTWKHRPHERATVKP